MITACVYASVIGYGASYGRRAALVLLASFPGPGQWEALAVLGHGMLRLPKIGDVPVR
jgi:hypothetical protein